jgi:hypothetical protein
VDIELRDPEVIRGELGGKGKAQIEASSTQNEGDRRQADTRGGK